MELYILSKQDLSILSICKLADYQINLDEETNAKSTFTLMKTNGLKKENYMVLNGLYRQFIFVIDDVQTEKESDVVTVTALDISNVFNRKVIEKNIDTMKSKSIEEFLANTISENFVNSDDTALNVNYIEIYWHTNTQGNVATNAENGLYNFHTFLINCRQYKNIYTDFKLENLGNPQTVEGKRINVEAKNRKIVDISLHGESIQKTRSGKNLLNLLKCSFSRCTLNSDNKSLTCSINNGYYAYVRTTELNNWLLQNKGKKITFSTGTPLNKTTSIVISGTRSNGSTYQEANEKGTGKCSITIANDFTAITSIELRFNRQNTPFTDTTTVINYAMLEEGSTATEYEQYGASPSPDYPSEIENIEGNIEVKVEGKNILNLSKCTFLYCSINSDNKSLTCSINNGYYAYVRTTELNNWLLQNKGKKITFSTGTPLNKTTSIVISGTRSNGSTYQEANEKGTGKCSITIANDFTAITSIELRFNRQNTPFTDTTTVINYAMLELGEPTDYEPYKSQVATFPLGEGQKLMEGSYLADDGIHHSRKQVVLDGTEEINYFAITQGSLFRFTNVITNPTNNIDYVPLSDHYIGLSERQTGTRANNNIYINHSQLLIDIIDNRFTSISDYKDWLSNNPITVEYELAEPEIVPYTAEQQEAWDNIKNLTLFEGVNHISSDANMVLKYYPLEPVGLKFVLRIDIENKQETTELIDTTLPEVADYNKIYEEDVTAKVQVYIREDGSEYNLYLKTDRTTTTNKDDPDRASGKIEVISVETADKAPEEALNVMKGNNYKHLVEFKIAKTSKLMDITKLYIGRPIRIKTDDDIYDSYISALTLSDENFVYFKSGSLRITLLDKLKASNNSVGNKLDVSGGKITGNLNINGILKNNNKTILDLTYPIGSIYLSIKNTNPSSLFGGIWEAWGSGRVPVGVDTAQTEFETVEKIGGEKTHTLTVDEMPSHNHNVKYNTESGIATASVLGTDRTASNTEGSSGGGDWYVWTTGAGGDEAHNNLQPYITCYMFKRVG